MTIVLLATLLVVLIAFVSLAVDFGRLRLARAQLQTVADAAARAGAARFPDSISSLPIITEASTAAEHNDVIDSHNTSNYREDDGVNLQTADDVFFGFWNKNTRQFTVIEDDPRSQQDERRMANAVRVHARRLQARQNPVKMIFAPVVGTFHKDEERMATAYIDGESDIGYGFVGIDGVESDGNNATLYGGVISDGDIRLGNGDIKPITINGKTYGGDARPGIGKAVYQQPNSVVEGWMAPLDFSLKEPEELYPVVEVVPDPPPPVHQFPSDNVFRGGVIPLQRRYYKGTWNHNKHDAITVDGYVRIYILDTQIGQPGVLRLNNLKVTWVNPTTPSADRLEFYIVGYNIKSVYTEGNAALWCHIYAPQCDVHLFGTADFEGWVIGKTLAWRGTAVYRYDGTLHPQPNKPTKIHLVE